MGTFRPAAGQIGFGIGGALRMLLSAAGLNIDVPLTGTAVTQTGVDGTAGRLLRVEDFGLGGSAPIAPASISGSPSTMGSGSYSYSTATSSGGPAAVTIGTLIHVARTSTIGIQILIGDWAGGATNRMWIRTHLGGWSAWQEVFTQLSVLGAVSQAAGVPTGAITEQGSNGNGRYTRFADGTQICRQIMAASAGAAASWTFPAAFSAVPQINGTAVATVLSCMCLDAAPTVSAAIFSARDKADACRADTCHMVTTGRWF